MSHARILWVDDEVELLKPQILFLEKKEYEVVTSNNATDALEAIDEELFDVVFLDENMPGISGLETLSSIKEKYPSLPVIMITKNEQEMIMEEAIGSKITDYLIKPVNPNQILLSLKKNLDNEKLITQKTTISYHQEFRKISMDLMQVNSCKDWEDVYKKITYWELSLEEAQNQDLMETHKVQKSEANSLFFKYVKRNYKSWLSDGGGPLMSHQLFSEKLIKNKKNQPLFLVVMDNLRYDQWQALRPIIGSEYHIEMEEFYWSILPTATQYARNAIFSGLLPLDMERQHPNYWKNDTDEGGKNLYEKEFLESQLKRLGLNWKTVYRKITNRNFGKKVLDEFYDFLNYDICVLVYNFVDMMSHAKTDTQIMKELASTDEGYRSITKSWFSQSTLKTLLEKAAEEGIPVYLTTDHGTINVHHPVKVLGDRETSTNLRYKLGRNMKYPNKDVLEVDQPNEYFLPKVNLSSKYIFAKGNDFFAYPNNYNHYVNYYRNTYQHGGISMEEMIIPFVKMVPK